MNRVGKVILLLLCLMLPLTATAEDGARVMPEPFASARHADPADIPYPQERDENGYLIAGSAFTSYREVDYKTGELETYLTRDEFVYENPYDGLWAYLSPTLQVQIIRYDGNWSDAGSKKAMDQRWFVADVKFDTAVERFTQHTWYLADVTGMNVLGKLQKNGVTRGDRKDQMIWPKTLAQADRMVLAVNGDYYIERSKGKIMGNILRQGVVINDTTVTNGYPNLDSAAFFPDGSMKVFDSATTTATEQQAAGAVDMVSFGPWLVKDGVLRNYDGKYYDHREPRMAVGMVEPGHYVIVDCEGRVPAKARTARGVRETGATGLNLNELGALLYYHGANEAINMDGGNTSVLIFMGEKLNDTGHDTSVSSPRNQHELFGVGKSELVRTDWANGKP